jgi:protein-S-isoprenylcysteine O-methyltransferase Ste14
VIVAAARFVMAPPRRSAGMNIKTLVGSGDRIGLLVLPFLVVGIALNVANPAAFSLGGPPAWLAIASVAVLVVGVTVWLWSVALILANVPKGRLITGGPYRWVRHPLYVAVALLVVPWLGFLLDTWLGVIVGAAIYAGARLFAPAEEAELSRAFGPAWRNYSSAVKLGWL